MEEKKRIAAQELDTRGRLMAAADRLFAACGFDATSTRDLAEAAGVNVAAVNYHFGGKESLYKEVITQRSRSCLARRTELVQTAVDEGGDIAAVLKAFVGAHLSELLEEGWESDVALFFRELANPGPGFEIMMKEMIEPTRELLAGHLLKGVPGMTPEKATFCIASVMGQMVHFVRARGIFERLAGAEYDEELVGRIGDHIVEFSLWGMMGRPEDER